MDTPDPERLFELVGSLPAAQPLLPRLQQEPPVHLVGGAVRDLLMGGRPGDLDLVVEGDAAALAARIGGEVKPHDRFGTSTVRLNGHSYDLARARRERYAHPGALPDVEPAGLTEDLRRRDFTVNAMAIALNGPRPGELAVAPCAIEDLEARVLRVLHDRSFIDDPTRLLRMCRYSSRLGFAPEPETEALARSAVRARALTTVSGPRVGAELRLLAHEPDPVAALASLAALGIDAAIEPALGIDDRQLAVRALALLPGEGRRDLLALALAARNVPAERLIELLESLAFEAGERDTIVVAATRAPELAEALHRATRPSEIAAAVAAAPLEAVALAGALGPSDPARDWLERLRHVRLEIDGRDLLAAGVPEGPAIGAGLRKALAAKLDGRAADREQELTVALRANE
jgi:tRNA nucleotidyltransferase (CCA-adding enzyme)